MKRIKLGGRSRWLLALLLLIGLPLAVASLWRSASKESDKVSQIKHDYEAQIRKGVGSEIKFTNTGDSYRDAQERVDSIARFISGRSDAGMSQATNARLTAMEARALSGKGSLVSVEHLANALTDTISERASNLNDEEISSAAQALGAHHDGISLRANGEFGMTAEEFKMQAKAFRDLSRESNGAARQALHSIVEREVNNRVGLLEAALPEHFGQAREEGLTPAQAVLITYSVVSDDLLDGSQAEVQREVRRLGDVANRKMAPGTRAEKAFGTKGRIFGTPLNLIFNKKTMSGLLDRVEKGRDSK